MSEHKYYKLDQIPKSFDVTLPQIKNLIDIKKITPLFFLQSKKMVIGGIDKNRMFVGYGVAQYSGPASIQSRQFSQLWEQNIIDANFLILHNPNGILMYSTENPFTVTLPSGLINSWQSTPLSDLTRTKLIAVIFPETIIDKFCLNENCVECNPYYFQEKKTRNNVLRLR